jgi:hypothetical protein
MAGAYALVGETDQALGWLEHAVTVRGWIDYEYFTRHDRFLESLRPTPQFQELMASARERYQRFTDDGTPTRVVSVAARSTFSWERMSRRRLEGIGLDKARALRRE